jgi:hypothetical protein
MEKFWQEADTVVKTVLTENLSETNSIIDQVSKQIIVELKKLYDNKYGDDGR